MIAPGNSDVLEMLLREDPDILIKEELLLQIVRKGQRDSLNILMNERRDWQSPTVKELLEAEYDSTRFGSEFRRGHGKPTTIRVLH